MEGRCFLRSVQLVNFMCHHNLVVEFEKQITCIVGGNGSGKSAIMIGLGILFGLKSSAMERGPSFSHYIKKGEGFSVIKVQIRNTDYRLDEFGNTITIQKTIKRDRGTAMKIYGERGGAVYHTERDLKRILEHFRVFLSNPLCYLTQDRSKKLLKQTTPGGMYRFFKAGTEIEETQKIHEENEKSLCAMRDAIERAEERSKKQKKTLSAVETALSLLTSYSEISEKVRELEAEKVWAKYAGKEKEVKRQETEKEAAYREYANRSAEKEKVLEKLELLQKEISQLQKEKLDRQVKRSNRNTEIEEEMKKEAARKREVEKEIEHFNVEISTHREQIRRAERIMDADTKAATQKQTEDTVETLEKRIEHEKKEIEETEKLQSECMIRKVQICAELERTKTDIRAAENSKKQKEEILRAAKELNPMFFYGAQTEKALALISRRGIGATGPLGLYITVKNEKWARAIEAVLGGTVYGYIVHTQRDKIALEDVFRECGVKKYQIYVTKTQEERSGDRIKEKAKKVSESIMRRAAGAGERSGRKEGNVCGVLSQIEDSAELAVEQLVILLGIEKIGLVEHREAGYALLEMKSGLESVYTKEGDKIQYVGHSMSDMRCVLKEKRLLASKDRAKEIEQEIAEASSGIYALHEQMKKSAADRDGAEKEIAELRERMGRGRAALAEAEEDARRKKSLLADELLIQHRKHVASAEQLEKQKRTIEETLDEVYKAIGALEQEKKKNEQEEEESAQLEQSSRRKQREIQQECEIFKKQLIEVMYNSDLMLQRIERLDREIEEAKKECYKLREDSLSASRGRVLQVTADPESIEEEIESLKSKITAISRETESVEQLNRKKQQLTVEIERLEKVVADNGKEIEEVGRWTEKRIERRKMLLQSVGEQAEKRFSELMEMREYAGALLFDHEKEELEMQVMVSEKSTGNKQSLSGGERSFAGICFLLSLWPLVSSPIRVLDEFDVFMDGLNRKAALQLILEISEALDSQIILITPLNVGELSSDICQVYTLRSPEMK